MHAQEPAIDSRRDTSGFGGHPRGLNTLFFTEMWERFSYYGMRALLILFMTATAAEGGLGFDTEQAGRIYGLYTASVYMAGLPGGWIADRLLGLRNAVFWGGVVIAAGHFSMAVPGLTTFYTGLALIVVGTGLLKPNISAMVGELYDKDDPRRDGGFSIYYMGINVGAFAAPLICGTLAQKVDWHLGFAAAGVGMVFGLIQYVATSKRLGKAGLKPEKKAEGPAVSFSFDGLMWLGGAALILAALILEITTIERLALMLVGSTIFIASLFVGKGFTDVEKRRGLSIYALFLVAALFWSGFEQAGSSLNLFADRMTNNTMFGYEFPSTWYQSLNPFYIFALAPLFSVLWIKMGDKQPSSPAKFAFGLYGVGFGFLVMVAAANLATEDFKVSPMWLITTYLLHTLGELCLSPVGLSAMTKLAPRQIVGQILGVWFLAAAIGNYMGGELATFFETFPLPKLFGAVAGVSLAVGVLVTLLTPLIKRQMGGVR
ncbi:MAG: peptide MFS transporter [Bryobacterales bacterium]|nr:peptide MFS transporter [Bryobacterales bacterium]